jgi:CubicO group peptidase (beta-lactamase class C family)
LGESPVAACSDTLWVLYSNTKILMATALWKLMEMGRLRFSDKVADHLPEFAAHGKGDISLFQVITHQGGFPNAEVPAEVWMDHERVRAAVADFVPEWPAGSRVHYHSLSAHWVLAMVMEAITGQDFRQVVTELVLAPLGLSQDLFMGLPQALLPQHSTRMAYLYEPPQQLRFESTSTVWQQAGVPGAGAYGTARGMVALYQMMLQGGTLNGVRLLSPRTLAYAIRNYTEERVDEFMGLPMHRGLGPHLRGESVAIRGLGSIAPASVYGHGGVGTSYCWADPSSGLSFAYLSNSRWPDPWHSLRLDQISNAVHAAIRPGQSG